MHRVEARQVGSRQRVIILCIRNAQDVSEIRAFTLQRPPKKEFRS